MTSSIISSPYATTEVVVPITVNKEDGSIIVPVLASVIGGTLICLVIVVIIGTTVCLLIIIRRQRKSKCYCYFDYRKCILLLLLFTGIAGQQHFGIAMSANTVYSCDTNRIISATNQQHIYCEITPIVKNHDDANIREEPVKNIWVPNPTYGSGSDCQKQPATQTVMTAKRHQLDTIENNDIEEDVATSVCPAYSQTTAVTRDKSINMVDAEKHIYEDLTNIINK